MGINLNPVSAIVESVAGGIRSVGGMIFGDKEARDKQMHDEFISTQAGYISEFSAAEKASWFSQFVDGANRLVRPFFTFGTVALFAWCIIDPAQFAISMQALALVPEHLWYILFAIIAFWFGSRAILDKASISVRPPSEAQVQSVLNNQRQLNELRKSYEEDKFSPKLKDNEHPIDNPIIETWMKNFKGANNGSN